MYYRITLSFLTFLLLWSCATDLENSREYLIKGDKKSAQEALFDHALNNDIFTLSEPDPVTGIDFLNMLEQLNSPDFLKRIYDLKFSEISTEKNTFIFSGRFSRSILDLSQKWDMTVFQGRLAERIENEIPIAGKDSYQKPIIHMSQFASIHLSSNKQPHPNLTKYWREIPHEKYLLAFKDFWAKSQASNASSIHRVLKQNLKEKMRVNKLQIIEVAEAKELDFIFSTESQYNDKSEFTSLRDSMKTSITEGAKANKIAADEIELLKPQILKASDRLFKLENERRDLQLRNQYTYEERVQCTVCTGRGEVTCGTCRGGGVCRYCTRGHVDCGRCFRRGFLDCDRCWGRGHYTECQRVWDPCRKCYVEKRVRVSCISCFGHGSIRCGCFNGRVTCRRCDGHFTCRTCQGRRFVDCVTCEGGTVIKIRKTNAGNEIDTKISAAQTQQSALLNRLHHLERLIRRHNERRSIFGNYLH